MQPSANDGRSGRILVISMIAAGVLLGLIALKFRQPFSTGVLVAPSTQGASTQTSTAQLPAPR
jgi:hypothetical protein